MSSRKKNWYQLHADQDQLRSAGIFEWEIEGVRNYVGRATNIGNLLDYMVKKASRLMELYPQPPRHSGDFRDIYHDLSDAHQSGLSVHFRVLETCAPDDLKERKRHWMKRDQKKKAI